MGIINNYLERNESFYRVTFAIRNLKFLSSVKRRLYPLFMIKFDFQEPAVMVASCDLLIDLP